MMFRDNISKESLEAMRENFGTMLTETKIRISTDIKQANKNQQSVRQYKKKSNACDDYFELAEEVL